MSIRACILGCEGLTLSTEESAFFKKANPWGFILFARNVDTPDQVRALCKQLRDAVGRDAPILIDQEGGRVARLTAPHWREWPAPLDQVLNVAQTDQRRAMALRYRLIAHELREVGIDVNCAPMLDIPQTDTHEIIINRCYGHDVDTVAEMGRAVSEGLLGGGVLPIIKHIPGHGRTSLDSHKDLPRVSDSLETLQRNDFVPFSRLADLPLAMTAHIVYDALDAKNCATFSRAAIDYIRKDIGFQGLLMTDDLSMHALSGSFESRVEKAIGAGCDLILHCNGVRSEMDPIVASTPMLDAEQIVKTEETLALRDAIDPIDVAQLDTDFKQILGRASG